MTRLVAVAVMIGTLGLLSGSAAGQSCAALAITGTINPGQTVSVSLAGSGSGEIAFAVLGETTGSTMLNFGPLGSLTLALAQPFSILPIGITDSSGHLAWSATVPANAPLLSSLDLFVQAVLVSVQTGGPGLGSPSLSFCTSNVVTLHVGP